MEAMNLSADVKKQMQQRLQQQEDDFLKGRKKKMNVNDFETLTIIGRGAFGEVRVCRKKDDKKIYAMKVSFFKIERKKRKNKERRKRGRRERE
jgi:serine/threonine protein kinase